MHDTKPATTSAQDFDAALDELLSETGKKVVAFLLLVPAGLLSVWVDVKLWAWFVMPLFTVPALTIPTALGLTIAIRALLGFAYHDLPDSKVSLLARMCVATCKALLILGVGALIHLWAAS